VKNSYQIPLNPPFTKGDFLRDAAQFPPLEKGGQGGFFIAGGETNFWFMNV